MSNFFTKLPRLEASNKPSSSLIASTSRTESQPKRKENSRDHLPTQKKISRLCPGIVTPDAVSYSTESLLGKLRGGFSGSDRFRYLCTLFPYRHRKGNPFDDETFRANTKGLVNLRKIPVEHQTLSGTYSFEEQKYLTEVEEAVRKWIVDVGRRAIFSPDCTRTVFSVEPQMCEECEATSEMQSLKAQLRKVRILMNTMQRT